MRVMEAAPRVVRLWPTLIAYLGLVVAIPVCLFAALLGSWAQSGVFDNKTSSDRQDGAELALFGLVAAAAALLALIALGTGKKRSASLASGVLAVCPLLLVLRSAVGLDGEDGAVVAVVALGVVGVAVASIFEARRPKREGTATA
jgi:hypothetical protein